jgi:hypothetical protein
VLTNGYGVLAGTLTEHHRDTPDDVGKWFHVNLTVAAAGRNYRCAIDVDSHQSNTGVEWKVIELRPSEWQTITPLASGSHLLASTETSGALDYPRDRRLRQRLGCLFVMMPDAVTRLLEAIAEALVNRWQKGSHVEATAALEGILEVGQTVYVFGEPFETGFGVHNIHQNQGDPLGSQWADENAIWQDGGTIVKRANGSMVAFISKFTSQSYQTDNQGHPLP